MNNFQTRRSHRAFTLIEMIGVLAVIAILMVVLVPALLRQMDRMAGEQEKASLKSIGDALQQSVLRNRYIPSGSDWATNAAIELGVNVFNVTTNARTWPRLFLIDPALQVGANGAGLPYTQYSTGSVVTAGGAITAPVSPRVLILSSIAGALPAGLASGIASSNDFNALWNWNDTSSALPGSSKWSGWPGASDDLKVQRLNLSPLFVHLLLNTYSSSGSPRYSIDSTNWAGALVVATNGLGVEAYFIQNSILTLYTHQGAIDSQQILIRDSSFVYNENVWRGSIAGGFFLGGLDVASTVDKFLAAPANLRAANGANQQALIVQAMQDYLDAYQNWAGAVFPNGALKTTAGQKQTAMMTAVQGLYQANVNNPTNVPCQ
jgi:prepilin-type N-terminal cleavage/methylation domain-containing protein